MQQNFVRRAVISLTDCETPNVIVSDWTEYISKVHTMSESMPNVGEDLYDMSSEDIPFTVVTAQTPRPLGLTSELYDQPNREGFATEITPLLDSNSLKEMCHSKTKKKSVKAK